MKNNIKLALTIVLAAIKNHKSAKVCIDNGDAYKAINKLNTAYHELFNAVKLIDMDNKALRQKIKELEEESE